MDERVAYRCVVVVQFGGHLLIEVWRGQGFDYACFSAPFYGDHVCLVVEVDECVGAYAGCLRQVSIYVGCGKILDVFHRFGGDFPF